MSFAAFAIARLPQIRFGCGSLSNLPDIAASYGKRLLLITGARSFLGSAHAPRLFAALRQRDCRWEIVKIVTEPAPTFIDATVSALQGEAFDAVIAIGGGSALDAAKAIAGLLKPGNSVLDHLEGVGPELPYGGPSTPLIAVPSTAGTGSEATRNAVLSIQGQFKKSFRDEQLVAEWAIVDPDLLVSCPPQLIAANGMDAFTQLLESFVSTGSNPMTDALARSGIMAARDALLPLYAEQSAPAREKMAYASLLSGICLAQTGLGAVHGLASPLGAFFSDSPRRGLRHTGRHGNGGQYCGDGKARSRESCAAEIRRDRPSLCHAEGNEGSGCTQLPGHELAPMGANARLAAPVKLANHPRRLPAHRGQLSWQQHEEQSHCAH